MPISRAKARPEQVESAQSTCELGGLFPGVHRVNIEVESDGGRKGGEVPPRETKRWKARECGAPHCQQVRRECGHEKWDAPNPWRLSR
jgi:hypothetical protein